jgi:phosphatidylglycerophosphate synthase
MKDNERLVRNIIVCQALILACQATFFGFMSALFAYGHTITMLYYAVAVVCAALFTFLLIVLRDRFAYEDGTRTTGINLPNALTLFRIGSLPTVFFLLLDISNKCALSIIIPFIAIVFVTDFLDGLLARAMRQTTLIGKYLDSSSDYLLLFFTSLIFFYYGLIPVWLFALLIARLVVQTGGVAVLSLKQKQIAYTISLLGKISVAATMILFVVELFRFAIGAGKVPDAVFIVVEIITGVIIGASLVEKAFIIKKEWTQNMPA